jgi:hypothetical protein
MTTAPPERPAAEAMHDVVEMVRSVVCRSLRFWPVMAVALVLSVVAFKLAPRFRAPVYVSEVVLAIRQSLQVDAVLGEGQGDPHKSRSAYLSDLLFSRPNLRWVIEQEHLSPQTVAKLGMATAAEDLRKQVRLTGGDSNTIVIIVEDTDPALAQRVARRLGESLVRQVGRDSAEKAEFTRNFLDQEQVKLAKDLQTKENQYAQFLARHPEFGADRRPAQAGPGVVGTPPRPAAETVDSADPSAALRRQADRVRRRLEQLKHPQSSAPAAAQPPALPQLTPEARAAIAAAEREVQQAKHELELRQTQYTGRHPDLVAAQNRLSSAEERLARTKANADVFVPRPEEPSLAVSAQPQTRQELEQQLRNLEVTLAAPKGSPVAAASGVAAGDGKAADIVSLEAQWGSLSRELAELRERYDSVQRRLFRAAMLASAETSGGATKLVVVEEAYLPERPNRRGPLRTGGTAALIVAALGLALILGLGYLDPRIVSQWDLDHARLGPIAVVVPRLKPGEKPASPD